MTIFQPGAGILYMKVGTHAQETLEDIIKRKSEEIEQAGYTLWGYGGNTCHPRTMVQPFAEEFVELKKPIHLCMEEMNSNHFADPLCAAEFSADGSSWDEVPPEIEVRGSRYALVIENLRKEEFKIPLDMTRVAVGPSRGRLGSRYIKGRVDKACFVVADTPERTNEEEAREVPVNLVADLRAPFAVFLRNYREQVE